MKRLLTVLQLLLLDYATAFAKTESPEMADLLRSNGKIYVVVAVLVIIFCCILAYLIVLDRKISSIENKLTKQK